MGTFWTEGSSASLTVEVLPSERVTLMVFGRPDFPKESVAELSPVTIRISRICLSPLISIRIQGCSPVSPIPDSGSPSAEYEASGALGSGEFDDVTWVTTAPMIGGISLK